MSGWLRWGTCASLLCVVVSLSCAAAGGQLSWWVYALDAFSVAAAVLWIARGFTSL